MRERLAEVARRFMGMEVRAPVAGEVHGMKVFAPGEVVRPREPILHIVPADAGLTIRARLEPVHVDQVHPGQEAALRFSGFSARNTPEFEGRIRRVSADRVRDERSGLSRYEVEVAMGAATAPDERPGRVGVLGRRVGHAGRGASAHRGALAAQLSRQAADRLFLTLAARGVRGVPNSVPAMTRFRA